MLSFSAGNFHVPTAKQLPVRAHDSEVAIVRYIYIYTPNTKRYYTGTDAS